MPEELASKPSRGQSRPAELQSSDNLGETLGEAQPEAPAVTFARQPRADPGVVAAVLRRADSATRAKLVTQLQRARGNAFVQRLAQAEQQRRADEALKPGNAPTGQRFGAGQGSAVSPSSRPAPSAVRGSVAPVVVQRHASFEHRLLGDAAPSELATMTQKIDPKTRQHVLEQELDRLKIWQKDPTAVTRAQVEATWPGIRVLTLKNGLILTYGELNTLPDYLANPQAIDSADRSVILPILQLVRQQGYNRIADLLDDVTETYGSEVADALAASSAADAPDAPLPASYTRAHPHEKFEGAVGPTGEVGTAASIVEVKAVNKVTAKLGSNQYQAVVARNACHFAPYSWHRWQEHHLQARDLAAKGHAANDPELVRQAWLTNGYADHFLQDSFAAGHLINKTLVMQWFVEWVAQYNARTKWYERNIHLKNWDQIKTMTTAGQPGLAARHLYTTDVRSPDQSTDPQTAEEQATKAERMNAAGVVGTKSQSQAEAYKSYLAFLNSAVVQSAAGALHDYFNERSLWVGSPARPNLADMYQIWGDETMVTSGEGVQIAGETAHLSQRAIDELVRTGQTGVGVREIRDRFPDRVVAEDANQKVSRMVPLEDWNNSLRTLCFETIFPTVHYRVLDTIGPTMGKVSQDLP